MVKKRVYIERDKNTGKYKGRLENARRSSTVNDTQSEAIEEMKRMHPDEKPHIQRVRHIQDKPAPGKWRGE